MKSSVKIFLAAVTVVSLSLLKYGAPPVAVLLGAGLAALITIRKTRTV